MATIQYRIVALWILMCNHDCPNGIPYLFVFPDVLKTRESTGDIITAIFEQYKYRVSLRVSRKISSIASCVVCPGQKLDRDTRDSDNMGDN